MDPSPSSVGFPLSGNPQSPENAPPTQTPSAEMPLSENAQFTGNPNPENHQPTVNLSAENPQSTQSVGNGPPSSIVSARQWNVEMAKLITDDDFINYMRGGECKDRYEEWHSCMTLTFQNASFFDHCAIHAGDLRDCVFQNLDYYRPLLTYLSDNARRW